MKFTLALALALAAFVCAEESEENKDVLSDRHTLKDLVKDRTRASFMAELKEEDQDAEEDGEGERAQIGGRRRRRWSRRRRRRRTAKNKWSAPVWMGGNKCSNHGSAGAGLVTDSIGCFVGGTHRHHGSCDAACQAATKSDCEGRGCIYTKPAQGKTGGLIEEDEDEDEEEEATLIETVAQATGLDRLWEDEETSSVFEARSSNVLQRCDCTKVNNHQPHHHNPHSHYTRSGRRH